MTKPDISPFLNIEQFKALWRQVRGPCDPY